MRGKRTYRKEFQFVGNGIVWRILDSFGYVIQKGKERNQKEARRAAMDVERRLPQVALRQRPAHLKRNWGSMRIFPNELDRLYQ